MSSSFCLFNEKRTRKFNLCEWFAMDNILFKAYLVSVWIIGSDKKALILKRKYHIIIELKFFKRKIGGSQSNIRMNYNQHSGCFIFMRSNILKNCCVPEIGEEI